MQGFLKKSLLILYFLSSVFNLIFSFLTKALASFTNIELDEKNYKQYHNWY